MTNADEILEQQKATCWQNKIRKADALLNSDHKNLTVSFKLRPLWKAAVIGTKGCIATYAITELEAEDGSWREYWTWHLQSRVSSFPALMSGLPAPNPMQRFTAAQETSLSQTALVLQNEWNAWKLILLLLPALPYVTRLASQFLYLLWPLFLRSEYLRHRFAFPIDSEKPRICYSALGLWSLRVKAALCFNRAGSNAMQLIHQCVPSSTISSITVISYIAKIKSLTHKWGQVI